MGIGGIGFGELLVILVVVMLLFGTQKLRNIGGDLGGAIKGFRDALRDGEQTVQPVAQVPDTAKQPPLAG